MTLPFFVGFATNITFKNTFEPFSVPFFLLNKHSFILNLFNLLPRLWLQGFSYYSRPLVLVSFTMNLKLRIYAFNYYLYRTFWFLRLKQKKTYLGM